MNGKRRILKYVGAVLSVAVLALWIYSLFGSIGYVEHGLYMICGAGYVVIAGPMNDTTGMFPSGVFGGIGPVGPLLWWPRFEFNRSQGLPNDWSMGIALPLWIPFVLLAIPTAVLWYRDRRRHPPGHCKSCGYDLTGNVSGVCSECGEPHVEQAIP